MKIGVLTEGRGEVPALPRLYAQLRTAGHQLLNPLFVDVPPMASPALIANRAKARVNSVLARDADRAILILDRETDPTDPVTRATEICRALGNLCHGDVVVVMKDRCVENWLIADPAAFSSQSALFPKHQKVQYPKGRADSQDAIRLIKAALGSTSYDKVQHPARIFAQSDVSTMRVNSLSFDRFVAAISGATTPT